MEINFELSKSFVLGFKEGWSKNKCYYYGFDLPGYDLNGDGSTCKDKTDTARECRLLCYYTRECAQYTWHDKKYNHGSGYKDCCLKKTYRDHYVHAIGAISGSKYCSKLSYEGKFDGT